MPYPYRYPNIPKPDWTESRGWDAPVVKPWLDNTTVAPSLSSRVERMIDLLEELAADNKKAKSKVIIIPNESEVERYG